MLSSTEFYLAWQNYCVKSDTKLAVITNMVLQSLAIDRSDFSTQNYVAL